MAPGNFNTCAWPLAELRQKGFRHFARPEDNLGGAPGNVGRGPRPVLLDAGHSTPNSQPPLVLPVAQRRPL
eukprot:1821076-Pyramimonas_sp.AAC.1